jgi:hypothetical protein
VIARSAVFLLLETAQDKPGSAQLKSRKRRGNRVEMPEDKGRDINAPCEPIKTRAHCNDGTDAAGGGAK